MMSHVPVWDDRVEACDMPLYILTVPARSSVVRLVNAALQPSSLADTLPAGRYWVTVTWRRSIDERVREIPAGTLWIGRTP